MTSERLFELCEKQLQSIVGDASDSIARITRSATQAIDESADLSREMSRWGGERQELELSRRLEQRVNNVLVEMQFFDELSQRIEHIMAIVNLLKLESRKEGFLSDPHDSEEMFENISRIFSIRSEFEVLRSIFPETGAVDQTDMVELF